MKKRFYQKRFGLYWALICLSLLLAGCDQIKVTPVVVAGHPLVGHWYGEKAYQEDELKVQQRLYLHIREDGLAYYANLICRWQATGTLANQSQLIVHYTPIKTLTTSKIVLQNYPLTPTFQLSIDRLPTAQNTSLGLDDVDLARIQTGQAPDSEQWHCQQ